jgi:putative endonuclease
MNNSSATRPNQSWWVYIVLCHDNTYYTGISPDVANRIHMHNSGKGAVYTRGRTPVILMYSEKLVSRGEASKREHALKKLSRIQKELLIKNQGPHQQE